MSRQTERLFKENRARLRRWAETGEGLPPFRNEVDSLLDDADALDDARRRLAEVEHAADGDVARLTHERDAALAASRAFMPEPVLVEHWEADEYVITVGGIGTVGGTMHKGEAERVAAWLRSAAAEIRGRKAGD